MHAQFATYAYHHAHELTSFSLFILLFFSSCFSVKHLSLTLDIWIYHDKNTSNILCDLSLRQRFCCWWHDYWNNTIWSSIRNCLLNVKGSLRSLHWSRAYRLTRTTCILVRCWSPYPLWWKQHMKASSLDFIHWCRLLDSDLICGVGSPTNY